MPTATFILCIAVASPLRRVFEYLPPRDCMNPPAIGVRVRVSFGRREMIGLLMEVKSTATIPSDKLKPALEIIDESPLLPEHLFKLGQWAAHYYQHPLGDALHAFLPVLIRQGNPLHDEDTLYALSHKSLVSPPTRASKQLEILNTLKLYPQGLAQNECNAMGFSKTALCALIHKGWVIKQVTHSLPVSEPVLQNWLREVPLSLNADQQKALEKINTSSSFNTFLLDGVTGSGKTEVYLQAIEKVIAHQQQALVLVPEIGLTPQTILRFKQRFNVPMAILHSGLTDHERLRAWVDAREGHAKIVIGTRSAVLTPLKNPGIIIIDEEHDISFKQQEGFRYHARDVSILRAKYENIPIVLGSATPSFESIHNAQHNRYCWLHLTQRAGDAQKPTIHLLDIKSRKLTAGLSQPLIAAIKEQIQNRHQVLIFLNRRGFAPTLMCHECGWMAQCHRCDARMTVHQQPAHLHCHHCDSQRPLNTTCPQCKHTVLNTMGIGTEQLESALEKLFPHTPVIRIDRDSTRRKHAMKSYLEEIQKGNPCILLGTQMLAKGHHFPHVTLVGIVDADSGLFSADFRGLERTAQLLIQVSGRAGRAHHAGQVMIQTHYADHPMIQTLVSQGYNAFATHALQERSLAMLPPYQYFAILRAEAAHTNTAIDFLELIKQFLPKDFYEQMTVLGPIPAPMTKRAGWFRAQLLFQSSSRQKMQQVLSDLCITIEQDPNSRRVRWSIDVDPQEMF